MFDGEIRSICDPDDCGKSGYSRLPYLSRGTCIYFLIMYTVNQLLFAATLFRDSSVINWIAASNFRDQTVSINNVLYVIFGSRREIFATMRLSRTSQNVLARK
jgi:hypothetical protein